MDTVYDFGALLQELRNKRGISQEQIASILGTSQSSISDWERNITEPDLDTLARLALEYGVTTDYLLNIERRRAEKEEADLQPHVINTEPLTEKEFGTVERMTAELVKEIIKMRE